LALGGGLMTVGGFLPVSAFCAGSALTAPAEIASATSTPATDRYRMIGIPLSLVPEKST
jgi:hypothetical protein